ncbi:MAG TPA: hypothetical protein VJN93_05500 [Candidatus Acidoferrum sp.]|nr:hypothetical protein [Candidatus Acidoferrum sp.]
MYLSKKQYLIGGGAVALAIAVGVGAATLHRTMDTPSTVPLTVPQNTRIHVTLDQALASDENRPGDHFSATVSQPVIVDGRTVIPDGARADGVVIDAYRSGRLRGRASLRLALDSIQVDGQDYDVETDTSRRSGGSHKKRDWAFIGGGAGGGALIGAIAGGGTGALIGAPVAAGAGTALAFFTGKKDIHLHPETPLTFVLSQPLTVQLPQTKS